MRLTIDIRPLLRPDGSVHAVLLIFTDQTRMHTLQRELEAAQENLEHSIEELQSANEELETTNEELQSTNEELETTNEELQSTNEELETLNEEARSTNEEMESVNEELRIQAEQASSYRLSSGIGAACDERRHHRDRPEACDPELEPVEREYLGPARRGSDRHELRGARHRPAGASAARRDRRGAGRPRRAGEKILEGSTAAAAASCAGFAFRACLTRRTAITGSSWCSRTSPRNARARNMPAISAGSWAGR
jgi:TolA-binding protein